jgi:hypothetical protein
VPRVSPDAVAPHLGPGSEAALKPNIVEVERHHFVSEYLLDPGGQAIPDRSRQLKPCSRLIFDAIRQDK